MANHNDLEIMLAIVNGEEIFTELGDVIRVDADPDSTDIIIRTTVTQFSNHPERKVTEVREHTLTGNIATRTWRALKSRFPHLLTDRCIRHANLAAKAILLSQAANS